LTNATKLLSLDGRSVRLNFSPIPTKGSLRHRRSGNRIPAGAIDLLLSKPVQNGSGAQPASYTIDTGPLSWR
jgi:hypothetical protein